MRKVINISIIVFITLFIMMCVFAYTNLWGISEIETNKGSSLYGVIQMLSYGIGVLILVLVLVIVKNRNALKDNQASLLSSKEEEEEEEPEENVQSIEERIKPSLEKFTNNLKQLSSTSSEEKPDAILKLVVNSINADIGILYRSESEKIVMIASYAFKFDKEEGNTFNIDEGLIGEVARTLKPMNIADVPEGYMKVVTGLGESSPRSLVIQPLTIKNKLIGIIELATIGNLSDVEESLLEQMCLIIAKEIKN